MQFNSSFDRWPHAVLALLGVVVLVVVGGAVVACARASRHAAHTPTDPSPSRHSSHNIPHSFPHEHELSNPALVTLVHSSRMFSYVSALCFMFYFQNQRGERRKLSFGDFGVVPRPHKQTGRRERRVAARRSGGAWREAEQAHHKSGQTYDYYIRWHVM